MEITFKKSCAKMPSIRRKQFISNFNSFQYKNQLFTNISLITMYLLLGLLIFIPTRTDSYRVFPQISKFHLNLMPNKDSPSQQLR